MSLYLQSCLQSWQEMKNFYIKPATLHFEGFYVGKTQKETLVATMHANVLVHWVCAHVGYFITIVFV